jgi:hypothetical protein
MAASNLGTIALNYYDVPGATPASTVFPIPVTNDDGSEPGISVDNAAIASVQVGGSDPNWMGTITSLGVTGVANITFSGDNVADQTLTVTSQAINPPETTAVTLAAVQAGIIPPALPSNSGTGTVSPSNPPAAAPAAPTSPSIST